jgi:aspartate/glutamate racemase
MTDSKRLRAGTVTIVHTSFLSVEPLTQQFAELAPDTTLRHIVDDSLLEEVIERGGVTPSVRRRMIAYFEAAESSGADLIFSQCSSVGEVADAAAERVSIPVVKIDSRAAEIACATGDRIGVIATLETALGPTVRQIEAAAARRGEQHRIDACLVEGAFERLRDGERAEHNRLVAAALLELASRVDVIVCAQGSMAAILADLGETRVPVLTSPRLGVEHAIEVLQKSLAQA